MVDNESLEDKSYRVNGFCQSKASVDAIKNYHKSVTDMTMMTFASDCKIKRIVVTSVDEFMREVTTEIGPFDYKNPVFYRAHANSNYVNVPSSLRSDKAIDNEDFMLQEFRRRYPDQFSKSTNTLEQLVVMQHYGSFSRCLDVTESPLVALAFVCLEEEKFSNGNNDNDSRYGTITVFRAQDSREDIKGFDSNTVGVLANTSKCKRDFKYGNLEIHYRNDGFESQIGNFIYFRDIIRQSVIVRTKQDNPRIRNQRGAFILVNANEIVDCGNCQLSTDALMKRVMNKPDDNGQPLNVVRLEHEYKGINEWDFSFKKVNPYSICNKYEEFRSDPFDLKRLYLKDKKTNEQIVFFIPPGCKKKIKGQLESLGFTYDFLYPEVDTVFHGITKKVIK